MEPTNIVQTYGDKSIKPDIKGKKKKSKKKKK